MPTTISHALAERHEALYTRLAALLRQVEAIAGRRPYGPVPAETRAIAEALLFEARAFRAEARGSKRKTRDLPVAAETLSALASQLGQARAALDSFEAARSAWSPRLKCLVWRVGRGEPLPIARLRPEAAPSGAAAFSPREQDHMRVALLRRIDERVREAYDEGYRAAAAGQPAAPDPLTVAAREAELAGRGAPVRPNLSTTSAARV